MPTVPGFMTLAEMREHAMACAREATDPLVAQQYLDLVGSYDAALSELCDTGSTIVPELHALTIPWRSVPLWFSNVPIK
ncbi:hypothetical protein [Flavisphingomonas formosensis]|uniref:hypothetical protein n=1 Tax=Flavisphingomonas formosensis TaxID=861534 RepID=UPI0012F96FA6|nr:hypothetical protein [Sphingomonas formosensis]